MSGIANRSGFFYERFISTQAYTQLAVSANAIIGTFGAWAHFAAGTLKTGKARWLQLVVMPDGGWNNLYALQLGLGAAGAETLWQPTTNPIPGSYPGFVIDFFTTLLDGTGQPVHTLMPWMLGFPVSTEANQELCARCLSVPGGGKLKVDIYLFN